MERGGTLHVRLWDAINAFARTTQWSVARQTAVVEAEQAVAEIESAAHRAAILETVERVRGHLTHGRIPGMSGATPASVRALLDTIEAEANRG